MGQAAGIKQSVQIGSEHIAVDAPVRLSVFQQTERIAPHGGLSGVDLIAVQLCPGKIGSQHFGLHPGTGLAVAEHGINGQKPHAMHLPAAFGAVRVGKGFAQHLIAAADTHHRRTGVGQLAYRRFQPALPQPEKVGQGALGAGEDDQIGVTQLPGTLHIPHAHSRMLVQQGEVGEVGNSGQTNHSNIQRLFPTLIFQTGSQRILVVHIDSKIRHHTQHRDSRFFLQHGEARAQNCFISPELIDNQAADARPLLLFQQSHRTVQLGEHAAPVNISRQQHRRVHQFRHAHVDNIIGAQVDLGRAARPFDDNDIVFRGKAVIGFQNIRDELALHAEILSGAHLPPDFAVNDNLTADVAGRLEQNGVHTYIRFLPGGLSLHHLRPAHFQAVPGHIAVQRHILAFKRSRFHPVLCKNPAQTGAQKAFSRAGHSALHHNTLGLFHRITSFNACIRRMFSLWVRTAVRYQFSSSP